MASSATRKLIANPSAMAVGLEDSLADACAGHLSPVPLMRVGHVVAACERMLVTRPQVIIAMTNAPKIETLRERVQDIRAELAELSPEMDELQIKAAVVNAKFRSDRRW